MKFSESTLMLWVDDKSVVPIGEPSKPVGTGVRAHNKSLGPLDGLVPSALNHDYHIAGCVPSVVLRSEIPENASDSFFKGGIRVCQRQSVPAFKRISTWSKNYSAHSSQL